MRKFKLSISTIQFCCLINKCLDSFSTRQDTKHQEVVIEGAEAEQVVEEVI